MKIVAVALLALIVCAHAAVVTQEVQTQFAQFTKTHGKVYGDEEYVHRQQVFAANMEKIRKLNLERPRTNFGVTEYADLTAEEFRAARLSTAIEGRPEGVPNAPLYDQAHIDALPTSWDWREKGAVTGVKNQGQCGSCWSFSTTGNVEGQWFLAGNKLTSLSEQNLVDCDHTCGKYRGFDGCDAGCNGGLQPNAFTYIIKNGGIDTEASYPYEGENLSCRFNAANIGAKIDNYTMVSENEEQMMAYLHEHGPISIAADAAEWQFYISGVFEGPCGTSLDHGILIVGYGTETDMFGTYKYWIVKNSWGTSWGIDGYMHIIRGVGECGLNLFASSAIINK